MDWSQGQGNKMYLQIFNIHHFPFPTKDTFHLSNILEIPKLCSLLKEKKNSRDQLQGWGEGFPVSYEQ